jgi:hypothetical protein
MNHKLESTCGNQFSGIESTTKIITQIKAQKIVKHKQADRREWKLTGFEDVSDYNAMQNTTPNVHYH